MSKSIIHDKKSGRCFLCGAQGVPLEEHHVFSGGCRKLSEHYGWNKDDFIKIFGRNFV